VVRAPAPPLPMTAIEMLGEAAMAIASSSAASSLQYAFKY